MRTMSLAVATLALLASVALADATSDARKQITAAYNKINAAAARKDANGMLSIYTADYVHVDNKGKKQGLAELKQMMPQMFALAKSIKATTRVQKVTLKGKTAVARVQERADLEVTSPQDPQKTAQMVIESSSVDTWVKTAKGWKQKLSRNLKVKQTLDGQDLTAP